MKLFFVFFLALTLVESKPYYTVDNIAIDAYDPVVYFVEKKARRGSARWQVKWDGVSWYFSSQNNLVKFMEEPEKYIPQYGGYCAYAMARNYFYKINPYAWTIHKGKLYLNASLKIRLQWEKEIENAIRQGDKNWKRKTLKN